MKKPPLRLALLIGAGLLVALFVLAFTLLLGGIFWHVHEGVVFIFLGPSVVAGAALFSWAVAPNTGGRHWAAVCTLSASLWAFSVAFAQYFSTCGWVSWLDLAIVLAGSVLALARIYRIKPGRALLRFALPLALSLAVGYLHGVVVRGFRDDPTM